MVCPCTFQTSTHSMDLNTATQTHTESSSNKSMNEASSQSEQATDSLSEDQMPIGSQTVRNDSVEQGGL